MTDLAVQTNETETATDTSAQTYTQATDIASLKSTDRLYSDTIFYTADEFLQTFKFCPIEIHIRGGVENVSQEVIDSKKVAMTFGKNIIIEDALTVWVDEDTDTCYILDGNNRARALTELKESGKKLNFHDVPVRQLLVQPTAEVLTRLQVNANDTTTPHSVLQLARRIIDLWNTVYKEALDQKATEKTASGKATTVCAETINRTKAYVGNLLQIGSAPTWLLDSYDNGLISLDVILKMLQLNKTSGHSLEMIYKGCQTKCSVQDQKISLKIFNSFKAMFDKATPPIASGSTASGSTGEGSTGEGQTSTPKADLKPTTPFDRTKGLNDIEFMLTGVFNLSIPDVCVSGEELNTDESAFSLARSLAKLNALFFTKSYPNVTKSAEFLDLSRKMLLCLFDDMVAINGLADEELQVITGHAQIISKSVGNLLAVANKVTGDDLGDDEGDDEGDDLITDEDDYEDDEDDEDDDDYEIDSEFIDE